MKLEIGSNDHFEIRRVQCNAAAGKGFTVLYLSDLHFKRNSYQLIVKMIDQIDELNPDIILLGGDYIDFKSQLPKLDRLLEVLSKRDNVFAIAGNHDYTFNIDIIRERMERHNIYWLENNSVCVTINNSIIQLDGTKPGKRKASVDLAILCLHQPINIQKFHTEYDIAFAGHLHGCQFVFWQKDKKLYPGRLFYKWNLLEQTDGNCNYYISKGMGDTLPVRFNCSKEMVFVQVPANHSINASL
ncbi:MAG: metallophosphoesterase [Ferruginibacter sp.]